MQTLKREKSSRFSILFFGPVIVFLIIALVEGLAKFSLVLTVGNVQVLLLLALSYAVFIKGSRSGLLGLGLALGYLFYKAAKTDFNFWGLSISPEHFSNDLGVFVFSSVFLIWGIGHLRRKMRFLKAKADLALQREEAEQRYHLIVENLKDHAVLLLDSGGYIQSWNQGAEQIFGYTPKEILGQHYSKFFSKSDIGSGKPYDALKKGNRQGGVDFENVCLRKNNQGFFAELTLLPLKKAKGELLGYSLVLKDISERHERELSLRKSEAHYKRLLDRASTLLFLNKGSRHFIWFSQRYLEFVGRKSSELQGEGWTRFIHSEDLRKTLDAYQVAYESQRKYSVEYRLRRFDGEFRWIHEQGTPWKNDSGEFVGFLGAGTDITDLKRTQLELNEAVKARDEFLSIASHELKTPLTSLRFHLQVLERAARKNSQELLSDPKIVSKLQSADRQVRKMALLIDDLLDISRIKTQRLHFDFEEVDLLHVVREVVAKFEDEAHSVGSDIAVHVEGEAIGNWDRVRMEQVIANLISNALKYGPEYPVEITLESNDYVTRLKVKDRGIGMTAADQARVFDRFERAVTSRNFGGLGLGLYIVRQIVEGHNGSITVESESGQGTTFVIELPKKPLSTQLIETRYHA